MGNDNKIKAEKNMKELAVKDSGTDVSKAKGDVLLFLQEELIPLRKKKEVTNYDLEHEYAKTRNNRNISIWVCLGVTLAVVVGVTWAVVTKMSATNRTIEVNLEAFEDLNLRNLFNALSKTQDLFEKTSKNKAELQAGLDSSLAKAKRSRDSDLEYIRNLKLPKKQRSEKEEKVLARYRDAVKAAHDEYDEKLVAADIELKQYEEQLKSFDSENVEKAQAWEKEMDSQRQVHEIEIKRLTEEYEAKIEELKQKMKDNDDRSYKEKRTAVNDVTNFYEAKVSKLDPVVKDANIKAIVQGTEEMMDSASFNPEVINESITNPDEEFTALLYDIQQKYDNYIALNNVSSSIPYTNGVSKVLKAERQLTYDMTFKTASTAASKLSALKAENTQLSVQLENAQSEAVNMKEALGNTDLLLNAYAVSSKVDGFILSAVDSKIIVFVESSVRANVKNDGSTKVNVLGTSNKKIGTGALWFKDGIYYVSLDEEAEIVPGNFIKLSKK
ncbi:MAG: hypothetical protein KBT21_07465 [Treponema sp.]|nr:hypothetical protein [Candidatus Treponema merdequi]